MIITVPFQTQNAMKAFLSDLMARMNVLMGTPLKTGLAPENT
jgi:hypothetical protein